MFHENQQIGNYTLIRKLGRGGFGEVWLAERKSKFVTTKVAVKLPHDEQVDHEAIKQEATLWEQASGHPNILPIIDADEYDGQIVIVSEYAPDGSLEQWLKTHGKMPIEKAVEMTIQILDGLEFLHSRNIIHRDLKPANILLQGNTPRLADFGISRALRTTVASQSQNISGTFAYMSPEALDGKRSIQTDIWSVGVNLYQFLTGILPFPNKEPSVLLAAIMMREFEPLPADIPNNLQNIIAKALAKLPENRYGSTKEMREDLQKILRGEVIPNFIQTDSGETLTVKGSSPQRKNVPTFVQNSQVETKTIVKPINTVNSKKANKKEWLKVLFLTVSLPIIILCGLYIFNYLSDTKMDSDTQVSKSGEFNNLNTHLVTDGNTISISNENISSEIKSAMNVNTKESSKASRNSNLTQINSSSVNMSGTIESNGNLATIHNIQVALKRKGFSNVVVTLDNNANVVLQGNVLTNGKMEEVVQIAQIASDKNVRNVRNELKVIENEFTPIEGDENPAVLSAIEVALRKHGITDVVVGISNGRIALRGSVPAGKMAEVIQIAQEAGKRPVKNELTEQ